LRAVAASPRNPGRLQDSLSGHQKSRNVILSQFGSSGREAQAAKK